MKRVLIYYKVFHSWVGGGRFLPLLFIAELQKTCEITLALDTMSDVANGAKLAGIPLDASKIYFLSGEFKCANGKPVRVQFGMAEWDPKGQIQGLHVNGVPESETMINQEAKAGNDYIYVFDASKWAPKGMVALGAAKDGSDLPNRNLIGPITKVELTGGDYKVTLKSPLKKDIPSETGVRCHIPRETFEYVAAFTAKDDFVKASGRIPVLPKANRGKIIIISPEPLEFREIKLEVFGK